MGLIHKAKGSSDLFDNRFMFVGAFRSDMAGTARPFSVTTVIRPLGKTNPKNRQGAHGLPEHQNNWDLTPIN